MYLETIIKIFTGIANSKIELNKDVCGKQIDEVKELENTLLKEIGDNEKLKRICGDYIKAIDSLHFDIIQQYFKEGFVCGVKTILEIYGVEGIALDKK